MAMATRAVSSPLSVRFGKDDRAMAAALRARARATRRSLSDQLKYYAFLGMIAEENPDLPLSVIEGILQAREEIKAGLGEPYQWGVLEPER